MRVLVCGSRSWADPDRIDDAMARMGTGTVIVHGNAWGADSIAGAAAQRHGFRVEIFPANWRLHGRRAGVLRNRVMLDTKPDYVLAFWDGTSRGTLDTIIEARRRGIQVEIISARSSR